MLPHFDIADAPPLFIDIFIFIFLRFVSIAAWRCRHY
jgi:hypothetical protein